MRHRKEIDGLRAIAILPVVMFHAEVPFFEGGFIGVDVFFVISGYLITQNIISNLDQNSFSLREFYEKRARRILPAQFLVMFLCIPLAWLFMLPDPLENFGQSVFASVLSLNNILLTLTSGYWELASEFKPLLHTWSLAVEEQFYLIFPVVVIGSIALFRRYWVVVVIFISIASFTASVLSQDRWPTSTFFLLHTRAWEIGVGILAYCWDRRRGMNSNGVLSVLGGITLLGAFLWFNTDTPHPSFATLFPVLGTALIISYGRQGTFVERLLTHSALVGIGLISYSLYLWHQPLYAFMRVLSFDAPSFGYRLAILPICLALAYLSWRFIETPFRDKAVVPTKGLVVSLCGSAALLSAVGLALHFGQGFPTRMFEKNPESKAGMHIKYNYRIEHFAADSFTRMNGPKVLVLGDSNARDFSNVLLEMNKLASMDFVYRDDIHLCSHQNVLPAERDLVANADIVFVTVIALEHCEILLDENRIEDLNVVFVGPKHFGYNLNAFLRVERDLRPFATAQILDGIVSANERNKLIAPEHRYVDIIGLLSDDGVHTRVFDDNGNILSADRVHLTKAGAEFLARKLLGDPGFENLFVVGQQP